MRNGDVVSDTGKYSEIDKVSIFKRKSGSLNSKEVAGVLNL